MTLRGKDEALQPEHLAELSDLFELTCQSLSITPGSDAHEEQRTRLACILLQLYDLRQLGPDQVIKAARRLMRQSSTEFVDLRDPSEQAIVFSDLPR
jgi:hypothetical protein